MTSFARYPGIHPLTFIVIFLRVAHILKRIQGLQLNGEAVHRDAYCSLIISI